jgi:hypothetical protein
MSNFNLHLNFPITIQCRQWPIQCRPWRTCFESGIQVMYFFFNMTLNYFRRNHCKLQQNVMHSEQDKITVWRCYLEADTGFHAGVLVLLANPSLHYLARGDPQPDERSGRAVWCPSRCRSSDGVGGECGGQLDLHETASSRGEPTSRDRRQHAEQRFRMNRRRRGRVLSSGHVRKYIFRLFPRGRAATCRPGWMRRSVSWSWRR